MGLCLITAASARRDFAPPILHIGFWDGLSEQSSMSGRKYWSERMGPSGMASGRRAARRVARHSTHQEVEDGPIDGVRPLLVQEVTGAGHDLGRQQTEPWPCGAGEILNCARIIPTQKDSFANPIRRGN